MHSTQDNKERITPNTSMASPEAQAAGNLVRSGLRTIGHPDIPKELKDAATEYIPRYFRLAHVTYNSEDGELSSLCAVCPGFHLTCNERVRQAANELFTTWSQERREDRLVLTQAMCKALGVRTDEVKLRILRQTKASLCCV
jgi:hypothetical protein